VVVGAVALTPEHPFIPRIVAALETVYGAGLGSIALFGSVARRTARDDSDLDMLLVVDSLPAGRGARLATFQPVREILKGALFDLAVAGTETELMPILRTPEELRVRTPLMLDLTEDAVLLRDRDGLLALALASLRARLQALGSKRIWDGQGGWYWDLKPDYRRGEIVEI
jgi:uncharacterized protein